MAFLNKANEDPAKGVAKSQEGAKSQTRANEFRATEEGVEVPKVLAGACKDAYYVSDADEPFEVVAIGWDEGGRGLPDEGEFFPFLSCWCLLCDILFDWGWTGFGLVWFYGVGR